MQFQPGVGVAVGQTTVNAYLSDFGVLAIVLAALWSGVRHGFAPLRKGRMLWVAIALFLVWIVVEVGLGHAHAPAYAWHVHAVTAAKFAEYALLAPALPLLLRSTTDLVLPLWSLVLWTCAATAVGVAQLFGAAIFFPGAVGHRQASFLSFADFAALAAAVLLLGAAAYALPRLGLGRTLTTLALVSGSIGVIVAGAVASVLGFATALVALVVVIVVRHELQPRRLAVVAAVAAVTVLGTVAIRGSDLEAFARFLGASKHQAPATKVQTYSHRTLLAWLGFEIWKDHPLVGVGWEGSGEPANFEPYLPAAHRRFPDVAALAFPAAPPDRRYGVQDVWIQALADLGVIGLALWAAIFGTAAWLALRAARAAGTTTALLGLLWTALLVWLWTAQGFIAGIPLDAVTWLAFGFAAVPVVALRPAE
ncbi:MAG: hypothetical protein QOK22_2785 [Gaiellaceae bacterium]|nr:hypothetical protein [Gaiellaceae bacterium]